MKEPERLTCYQEQVIDDCDEYCKANNLPITHYSDKTLRQMLDEYLGWNGILGFTDYILAILELKGLVK